jgi:AraC family transcriptional regulator of adaptative response/methylated-DNA-[protein]-cysteine methyltransferase
VGVSPREYAEACRLNKVRRGLQHGGDVTTAMVDAGYGSSSRFYERAVPKLGMMPSAYRNGGPGATIGFTIVGSPLGRLLVAATARGVCAVKLGDSDATLRSELAREFNAATILEDDESLTKWTRAVLLQLDPPSPCPERARPSTHSTGSGQAGSGRASRRGSMELPLDIKATAFQWRVWQALTAIPYGETRTYGAIAAAIGQPKAVRAVARACATNPVALAIPCHRVVPASGGEGGYRWGAQRKRALLKHERSLGEPGGAGKAGKAGREGTVDEFTGS